MRNAIAQMDSELAYRAKGVSAAGQWFRKRAVHRFEYRGPAATPEAAAWALNRQTKVYADGIRPSCLSNVAISQ